MGHWRWHRCRQRLRRWVRLGFRPWRSRSHALRTALIGPTLLQTATRGVAVVLSVVPANPRAKQLYEHLALRSRRLRHPFSECGTARAFRVPRGADVIASPTREGGEVMGTVPNRAVTGRRETRRRGLAEESGSRSPCAKTQRDGRVVTHAAGEPKPATESRRRRRGSHRALGEDLRMRVGDGASTWPPASLRPCHGAIGVW